MDAELVFQGDDQLENLQRSQFEAVLGGVVAVAQHAHDQGNDPLAQRRAVKSL
jgi:hypothetical protein